MLDFPPRIDEVRDGATQLCRSEDLRNTQPVLEMRTRHDHDPKAASPW